MRLGLPSARRANARARVCSRMWPTCLCVQAELERLKAEDAKQQEASNQRLHAQKHEVLFGSNCKAAILGYFSDLVIAKYLLWRLEDVDIAASMQDSRVLCARTRACTRMRAHTCMHVRVEE